MGNKNISTPCFNLAFFILLSAFILQSCVSHRDASIREWEKHEWHLVKVDINTEPTWKIFTRKLAGTTFLEYKIEGNINSSTSGCLAAFKQDLYHQAGEAMQKKFPTYDISEESEKAILTYVIHNEPFPFKNTEMRVRYSFYNEEDGGTGVKWREAWEDSPIQAAKKLKRVETFRGSWVFTPIDIDSSQGENTVQFDPKKMPRWLFEPMVFKFLKGGLNKIKEITNELNEETISLSQH